jgi:hypothetical protein
LQPTRRGNGALELDRRGADGRSACTRSQVQGIHVTMSIVNIAPDQRRSELDSFSRARPEEVDGRLLMERR